MHLPENLMKNTSLELSEQIVHGHHNNKSYDDPTVVLAKDKDHDYIEASDIEFNRAQVLAAR